LITDSFSDSKHDLSKKHLNGLTLIWSEEFEEDMINESIWNFNIGDGCEYGLCGWGNNELQYHRREHAFIENGSLVIEARKEVFIDESTGKIYDYEWVQGFGQKFGLVMVDFKTKKRYLCPIALVFREIATHNGIPDELEHLTLIQ